MEEALRSAVSAAVGGRVTQLEKVERTPLDYDAFLAHRTVSRLQGYAMADGARVPWTMIEKRTDGPGLASPYLLDNGSREFAAYGSGVLADVAPGIGTPTLHGSLHDETGGRTLWLEAVHHEGNRPLDAESILAAARDLGGMAGRWLDRELAEPWYFTGWIDRHSQPEAVEAGHATLRRTHPDAVTRLGDRMARTEQLILNQAHYRTILESLPQTLCHHDAVGANIFRSHGRTVLIDWESVGAGPVGADLASLVFSSVRRGDARTGVMLPVVEEALRRYAVGLRSEAPNVAFEDIRLGFDAAVALRWKLAVDVVAGLEKGQPPRRGSLPDEDPAVALEELVLLVDLLLASADRALHAAP
jgi:PAS domain-containing protein